MITEENAPSLNPVLDAENQLKKIEKEIEKKPWEFSFHQMLFILELLNKNKAEFASGKKASQEPSLLNAYASFSVPSSDCVKFEKNEDSSQVTINQTSLVGINGILPQIYTEKIIQKKLEKNEAPNEFLNIFHQRIFGLKHKVEKKIQFNLNKNPLDNFHFHHSIGGIDTKKNHWQEWLSSKSYFLWKKIKNSHGLIAILNSVFPFHFQVEEFIPKWIKISEESRAFLNKDPMKNKMLGHRAKCFYQKIRLIVTIDSIEDFQNSLPGTQNYNLIKKIARYYVTPNIEIEYKIQLNAQQKKQIKLTNASKLGYNTWLIRLDSDAISQLG